MVRRKKIELTATDLIVVATAGLLALYPATELTRVIKDNEFDQHLNPEIKPWQYECEIGFIWAGYIGGLILLTNYIRSKNKQINGH